MADVLLNVQHIKFKLDSGADVSVLPAKIYNEFQHRPALVKPSKKLYGPCCYKLKCMGKFQEKIQHGQNIREEDIYVIADLDRPLLSRTACQELGIIGKIDE